MKTIYAIMIIIFFCLSSCKIRRSRDELEGIYYKAQIEAEKENFKDALNIIETNIKGKNRDFAYYRFHGMYIYYENKKNYATRALEDFKKSYELKSDSFITNSLIGRCYLTLGDYTEALNFLEKANELYKDDMNAPPIYYELAEAYLNCGKMEEALNINTQAIQRDSNYSWNYMQRGIILSQNGDKNELTKNYNEAIQKDPNEIGFHKELINRYIEMNYCDDAYELCITLLKDNENYDWCYAYMGYILLLSGDFDKSFKLLEKALEINNKNSQTLKYLSFYYYFTDDLKKAWEYDMLASIEANIDVPLFETQSEYLLKYKSDKYFILLHEKLGNT
jgi:tetratricopeptide (TPR) repeat protein